MMICGLLGRKLGHSFSPQIHALLADYEYRLFEKEPEDVGDFLQSDHFEAINVTVPYKETVIPFLDELAPGAQRIGAVNTIIRRDGRLVGDNTDYYGFTQMVSRTGAQVRGMKVLILGSGGASKTVRMVLEDLGAAQIITISRSGEDNYENLDRHCDADMIVNATPVGMYPNNYIAPVDLSIFKKCKYVLDLIYNPLKTRLLLQAESLGMHVQNGLWMLVAQAKKACELFQSISLPDSEILRVYSALSLQSRNIVLVGMPGCGKSTVGKLLANLTGRRVYALDTMIADRACMPIPEIFEKYGEDHFRAIESEVLRDTAKNPGVIIDCGGGIVTRSENFEPLQQNGFVVFLNRGWQNLPKDGRPISQRSDLSELYAKRLPLYRAVCSIEIDSTELQPEQTAQKIMEAFNHENSCT